MKYLTLFLISLFLGTACIQNTKNIPDIPQNKLKTLYPKAEEVKWDKEDAGFEANFKVGDVETSVIFDAKGNVLETETEIEKEDLPKAIKFALEKDFAGYDIEEAAKIEKNGKLSFEAQVEKGDSKLDAIYNPNGTLIKKNEKRGESTESQKNELGEKEESWQKDFGVNKSALKSVGENLYFILKPGYQLILSGKEDSKKVDLVITVLNETKMIDGVEIRIVEERESQNGSLVEVSRNFYTIDPATKDVYYFGEAVDIYKDGKVVGHEGAWQSGENGAHFGLMIPGKPRDNQKYYQEMAPKMAMDRAEVKSMNETLDTPAGHFINCLKTEETTHLEPGVKEYKMYAPGVGLIWDGSLKLVSYGNK